MKNEAMETDMSAYRVTELTPEEASETSGGWAILVIGFVAAAIVAGAFIARRFHGHR
ncbi:hypothetical protein [Bradyrhizobium sp. Cp5.3]|uniref:hypothetical protein n=1 Tax=Bradyrhizobium sp. Cp5.3 TaxID=443598 RepID=UPI0012EB143F|nr:hypothetical protein [Bradyrhizobium sp. Cp5.3]